MNRQALRAGSEVKVDEQGSITPLILLYFTIVMLLIFLIANVSAAYVARRDLTSRVEGAIAGAVQEIDEVKYYYDLPLTAFLVADATASRKLWVPIDCGLARDTFSKTLALQSVGTSVRPAIQSFECDGKRIEVQVSERFFLPFRLSVFAIEAIDIRVKVGAGSIFQ